MVSQRVPPLRSAPTGACPGEAPGRCLEMSPSSLCLDLGGKKAKATLGCQAELLGQQGGGHMLALPPPPLQAAC